MAKLPEEFISRLKSANDIVDLFRLHADLKKRGRIYVCCCPFHAEKTPSCTIYPDDDPHFYCFGCHEGGDVITFVMKTENLTYMEAVRTLAQRCGMTVPSMSPQERQNSIQRDKCYEINRETANFYYGSLLRGEDKQGLQFLANHQIKPQTVKEFGIGYAPDDWHLLRNHLKQKGYSEQELVLSGVCRKNQNGAVYDTFRNRILFPVVDLRGNVTGFGGMEIHYQNPVFVHTEYSPAFQRGQLLFALHTAKNASAESLILAENYLCVLTIWQTGFKNVIAVPGNVILPSHAKLIAQHTKEVILISSGIPNQQILNLFSETGLSVKSVQTGNTADSADFIRKYGAEAFRTLVSQAGDARKTEIETIKNSLEDEQTKLQRSINMLTGIQNPLEREVYMTNTAKEMGISLDMLRVQVDSRLHHAIRNISAETRSLSKEELFGSPVNQKKITAGKQVLIYMIQNPQKCRTMEETITPQHFVTDFQRKLYQALCQVLPDCTELTASMLETFFSKPEFLQVKSFLQDNKEFSVSPEALNDCISALTG